MISTTSIEKAKQLIKKSKDKIVVVQAQDNHFNRKLLEYGKFHILLSPETQAKKDHSKYLDSGLNHVMAKIAAKNKIAIGIDLKRIQDLDKKQKALTLARIKQNIKVCRKAKCKLALLNYKDEKDAFDFLISLGASTGQAKEAIF
ncbi:MAG: hypothetical protein ABIG28_01440 [archaeon]